ncbi:type I-E CRISPR-associated endoribonuclease Cas2e [Streptomyces sp. NPDC049954]|uniref:type I-E CRISPR-associated endoribonuclease Cas2e n=1 Tax=Streptomyces sp. NPDC049954 TaxID=3155779 RepID=UPI003448663E
MTVIVLTNCPAGLRGFLTRWLQEISAGVFVGNPSAWVRDVLWEEVRQYAGQGRALLAHTTNNEQGFTFRTHDHAWHPADYEGATLIHRPIRSPRPPTPGATAGPPVASSSSAPPWGWSRDSKRRRFGC